MDDFAALVHTEFHIIHEAKDPGSESDPQIMIAFHLNPTAHVQDGLFQKHPGINRIVLAFKRLDE